MRLACLALMLLAGCKATLTHRPAPPREAASRTFDASFDDVWSGVVSWFATNNIAIDKIEKTSGLITARRAIAADRRYLDVGEIETTNCANGTLHFDAIEANVNALVQKVDEQRTRLTINVFGAFQASARAKSAGARSPSISGPATSTGALEASVFAHLEAVTKKALQ